MTTICNAARSPLMGREADETTAQALRRMARNFRAQAEAMPPSIGDNLRRAAAEFERRAAALEGKTVH